MAISWTSRKHKCRYKKSDDQYRLNIRSEKEIFSYTKKCLTELGVDTSKIKEINDVKKEPPYDTEFYEKLKKDYDLENVEDIIWMKFTKKKKHLGVVATSNDINFDKPNDATQYYDTDKNGKWKYNFSGVIINHLNENWNEDYVFVFPLPKISNVKYSRHKIEKEVGDYLLRMKIPILDYYSHKLL